MLNAGPPRDAVAHSNYPSNTFEIDDHKVQWMTSILDRVSNALDGGDIGTAERHLRLGLLEDHEKQTLM